jgi:uncharacterized membrane protein YtjA (UPF0391 family)
MHYWRRSSVDGITRIQWPAGWKSSVSRNEGRDGTFQPHIAAAAAHAEESDAMLGWALTFLIVAIIAAVLGFGGIAGLSIEIAKIIFFVAIVLFAISAIFGLVRGRRTIP